MPITLTHVGSGTAATLAAVLGYQSTRAIDTVVHTIIGRSAPDFTLKPVGPRTGTFRLYAADESVAASLVTLLSMQGSFILADTATTIADTTFTPTGNLGVALDENTLRAVVVTVDYTEILP